jgi:hypothetical protein
MKVSDMKSGQSHNDKIPHLTRLIRAGIEQIIFYGFVSKA